MGTQKTLIQKTYEINVGQDSLDINFLGTNRQFHWTELTLVYGKGNKHTSIYDSYNVEMASKILKSVRLTKFTEIYNLTNGKKYGIENLTQKHFLLKAKCCPLSDYMHNPVLIPEDEYLFVKSDESLYLDLRASSGYVKETEKLERNNSKITLHLILKQVARKKLWLRVWA